MIGQCHRADQPAITRREENRAFGTLIASGEATQLLVGEAPWCGVFLAQAQVGVERPGAHMLAQDRATAAVGQDGDSKVARGREYKLGLEPVGRAAMLDDPHNAFFTARSA